MTAVVGKVRERDFDDVMRGTDWTVGMTLSNLIPKEGATTCDDDAFTKVPMDLTEIRFFMQLRVAPDDEVLATLDSDAGDGTIVIDDDPLTGNFDLWISREITASIPSCEYSLMMITGSGEESRADCILKGRFQFLDNVTVVP